MRGWRGVEEARRVRYRWRKMVTKRVMAIWVEGSKAEQDDVGWGASVYKSLSYLNGGDCQRHSQ